MVESRRFVREALTLALAYLASGKKAYARAACRRMASISRWDPDGSSHIAHNDEAHMSVIWDGRQVCDWVWEGFTEQQRQVVIEQFRQRGRITYQYMHDRGLYGVTRFDSHAGRETDRSHRFRFGPASVGPERYISPPRPGPEGSSSARMTRAEPSKTTTRTGSWPTSAATPTPATTGPAVAAGTWSSSRATSASC